MKNPVESPVTHTEFEIWCNADEAHSGLSPRFPQNILR